MVKTLPSSPGGTGSFPGPGAKTPHASQPKSQNMEPKQYCNKFNKDLKMVHIKKKIFTKFLFLKNVTVGLYPYSSVTVGNSLWSSG